MLPREEDQEHRPCEPKRTQRGLYPHKKKSKKKLDIYLLENLVKNHQRFPTGGNVQIQRLKDNFKKQTEYCDKKMFFSQIMTLTSDLEHIDVVFAGKAMQSRLKGYHQKHEGCEKQFAFAFVDCKNGKYKFWPPVYPHHANNNSASSSTTTHSEEILIGNINDFLQKGTKPLIILIYSYNSPCCKREKRNIDPCMFKLLYSANQWYNEYGIITVVAFTKFYGLSGPIFFSNVDRDICTSNDFCPYIEKCKKIPFSLDSKDFRKKKREMIDKCMDLTKERVEATYRYKLHQDITSAVCDLLKLAEISFCLKEQHLDSGVKMISSFTFHQKVKDKLFETLKVKWDKMVDNSSASLIRERMTTDFNTGIVKLFVNNLKSFFGNSSPLYLYQVEEE